MNILNRYKQIKNKLHIEYLIKQMRNNAVIGDDFTALVGALILNESGEKSRITIGHNCRLNGLITCTQTGSVSIGNFSTIQVGAQIRSAVSIKIGSYTGIAEDTIIADTNTHSTEIEEWIEHRIRVAPGWAGYPGLGYGWEKAQSAPVVIGDGVWIGGASTILKGVTIGDGAIVARASVVAKNVEPFTIVAGNPAKKVKQLRIPEKSIQEIAAEVMLILHNQKNN